MWPADYFSIRPNLHNIDQNLLLNNRNYFRFIFKKNDFGKMRFKMYYINEFATCSKKEQAARIHILTLSLGP